MLNRAKNIIKKISGTNKLKNLNEGIGEFFGKPGGKFRESKTHILVALLKRLYELDKHNTFKKHYLNPDYNTLEKTTPASNLPEGNNQIWVFDNLSSGCSETSSTFQHAVINTLENGGLIIVTSNTSLNKILPGICSHSPNTNFALYSRKIQKLFGMVNKTLVQKDPHLLIKELKNNFEEFARIAAAQNNIEALRILFTSISKAYLNMQSEKDGMTPLMLAAENGALDATIALLNNIFLRNTVNISLCSKEKRTALHYAAIEKNIKIFYLLLKRNALDADLPDVFGKTAQTYALENKITNKKLIELILTKSSNQNQILTLDENEMRVLALKCFTELCTEAVLTQNDLKEIAKQHSDDIQKNSEIFNMDACCALLSYAKTKIGIQNLRKLFINALNNPEIPTHNIFSLIKYSIQVANTPMLNELIKQITTEPWNNIKKNLEAMLLKMHFEKFKSKLVGEVLEDFLNKSEDVRFPLSFDEVATLKKQYARKIAIHTHYYLTDERKVKDFNPKDFKANNQAWQIDLKEYKEKNLKYGNQYSPTKFYQNHQVKPLIITKDKLKLLAAIRHAIKEYFGILPYNLQMMNILALLNAPNGKRLAQIKTGEGKSIVIAILAAFQALNGEKVDIITSSCELARRDAKKFEKFYEMLGLSVSHNTDDSSSTSHTDNIVYGTNSDFEFYYLYCQLGIIPPRHRRRDTVIIDEADSMIVDRARIPVKISDSIKLPAYHNSKLYKLIWQFISSKNTTKTQIELSIYLHRHLSDQLNGQKIPDDKIKIWLDSAKTALRYKENVQYIIKDGKIIIVDNLHTGEVLSPNIQWTKGLYQILEAKHNLKITEETGTAATITHPLYLNLYTSLYGVTGTLGDEDTKRELTTAYPKLDYYDSPRYLPSKKVELSPIITGKDEYNKLLVEEVNKITTKKRPILIICGSIKESLELYKLLQKCGTCVQIYNDIQKKSSQAILACAGIPGAITIATNIAGRGANIIPTPEAENNGGLHVFVTFPTANSRVEEQAFGRTGRQGRTGTCQYFLRREDLQSAAGVTNKSTLSNQDLYKLWRKKRKEKNEFESKSRINALRYHELLQSVQECYFPLDRAIKLKLQDKWAEFFTKIDNYAQDCIALKKKLSDLKKYAFKEIQKFWQENFLSKTPAYSAFLPKPDELLPAQKVFPKPCQNPTTTIYK